MKEKNKMVYNFCYEAAKSTMISLQCNVLMHISAPVISVQLPSIGWRQLRRCWSADGDILIKLLSFEIYDRHALRTQPNLCKFSIFPVN